MSALPTRALALLVALTTAFAVALVPTSSGEAVQVWATESTAQIKPGVQMYTNGAQCTANFVFRDKAGNVYVGYAAHCAGKGDSNDTNGCSTPSLPLGTPVQFVSGGNLFSAGRTVGTGKVAYSSWASMQRLKTKNVDRCAYNDFALVRVDRASVKKVNPTVPTFGGPTGLAAPPLAVGAAIYSVGNSSLRSGSAASKSGKVLGRVGSALVLAYEIRTGNPGIPGDSGSGFMDATGRAAGVLSTLNVGLGLTPVSNTMGNLVYELAWAQKYSGIAGLVLAHGTRGFTK